MHLKFSLITGIDARLRHNGWRDLRLADCATSFVYYQGDIVTTKGKSEVAVSMPCRERPSPGKADLIMSGATNRKPKRRRPPVTMNLAEFVIHVEAENANVNIPLLRRAYEYSEKAHRGQVRESGEPYINHCLAVAMILAEQHLDTATIAAGMIHDVVEDTEYSLEAVTKHFGDEIAELVDGVTKISGVSFKSREEEQVEYFRKMLLSMAHDIRVIVIKLADRLHNMRTLEYCDPEKRIRIATETGDVYGPLAHRFGMARMKWELEDLTLKHLKPDRYNYLVEKIELRREDREAYLEEVQRPLRETLRREGLASEITGRAKHLASINRKMLAELAITEPQSFEKLIKAIS